MHLKLNAQKKFRVTDGNQSSKPLIIYLSDALPTELQTHIQQGTEFSSILIRHNYVSRIASYDFIPQITLYISLQPSCGNKQELLKLVTRRLLVWAPVSQSVELLTSNQRFVSSIVVSDSKFFLSIQLEEYFLTLKPSRKVFPYVELFFFNSFWKKCSMWLNQL